MLIRWEFVSRIKTALREKRWLGNSLSFLGTFLLLALAWRLFLRNAPLDLLKRCSWRQLLPLAALFMVLFAINGYHYFYLLRRRGIRMEKKDILLFPLAMGLWGILLPLQGTLVYALWFFKRRYRMTLSSTMAVSLFLYLFTVVICGALGVFCWFFCHLQSILFLLLSVLMLVSPLLLFGALALLRRSRERLPRWMRRGAEWFEAMLSSLTGLLADRKLVGVYILLYGLRLGMLLVAYGWIAAMLGFRLNIIQLILLNLWGVLGLIIKITPQNLGVGQLISGALFVMLELPPEDAVIMSLVFAAIASVLELTLGVVAHFMLRRAIARHAEDLPPEEETAKP